MLTPIPLCQKENNLQNRIFFQGGGGGVKVWVDKGPKRGAVGKVFMVTQEFL